MNKRCGQCKKILNISCFVKNSTKGDGLASECKECRHDYFHKRYPIYRDKLLRYGKEYGKKHGKRVRAELKRKAINEYGGKCACCNEMNIKFLTLDHINNDGFKETKSHRADIYRLAIKNNLKNKLQIMCYNCNLGKARNNGVCPHLDQD